MTPTRKAKKTAAARGPLKPMRVSIGFRDFVLDQLSALPDVHARAMFGGVGLYAGDHFFGILAADVLYFKADEATRHDYEAAGSKPFEPYVNTPSTKAPITMPYYAVPVAILEHAPTAVRWARRSIGVARAAKKRR